MNTIVERDYAHSKLNKQVSISENKNRNVNPINSSSGFNCSDIYDIGPEDLKWPSDMLKDINNNEKLVFKQFCFTENEIKNNKSSSNSDLLNYNTMEENSLNFPYETDNKNLQMLDECSEIALKRLYQKEQNIQSDVHTNNLTNFTFIGQEHVEDSIGWANQNDNLPCDSLKSNFYSKIDYGNQEKSFLHTETISLIKDGIAGIFSPEDSVFLSDEISNENEQVVPISNQMIPDQSGDPDILFDSATQYEIKSDNDCGKACSQCNMNPNQLNTTFSSHELLTSNEQILGSGSGISNKRSVKNKKINSKKKKLFTDINFTSFQELLAFTPGGQIYKLNKETSKHLKTEGNVGSKMAYLAAEINHYKKIIQVQSGILIPGGLDVGKEESFNFRAIEEKEKAKKVFTAFDVDLNIKYLSTEYELIKSDRKMKQYMKFNPHCVLEALELIEGTDIELINLVYVAQVYETILKVTKICNEGSLGLKSRAVLKKFQSLISAPQGIEAKEYLDELCLKENIHKSKPLSPIEWVVHLMILK